MFRFLSSSRCPQLHQREEREDERRGPERSDFGGSRRKRKTVQEQRFAASLHLDIRRNLVIDDDLFILGGFPFLQNGCSFFGVD